MTHDKRAGRDQLLRLVVSPPRDWAGRRRESERPGDKFGMAQDRKNDDANRERDGAGAVRDVRQRKEQRHDAL